MAGIRIVGHTGPTMERKGSVIHAGGLGNCKMIPRYPTEFRARICETKKKILRQAQEFPFSIPTLQNMHNTVLLLSLENNLPIGFPKYPNDFR